MRNLLDFIKNLEQSNETVSSEIQVEHDLEQAATVTPDHQITVDTDQDATVSSPRRNNVKKYGRKFQR